MSFSPMFLNIFINMIVFWGAALSQGTQYMLLNLQPKYKTINIFSDTWFT